MKRILIIGIVTVLILGLAAAVGAVLNAPTTTGISTVEPAATVNPCPAMASADIIYQVNQLRTKAGLSPLVENAALDRVAQLKGADMVANHYYSHTSPSGVSPWYWFGVAGYQYRTAAENLAQSYQAVDGAVTAWDLSPGHRANMLGAYTETGAAVVCGTFGGSQTDVLIQEFGTR